MAYPPKPVLCGATTAMQIVAATAASTAFPNLANILMPIWEQLESSVATAP